MTREQFAALKPGDRVRDREIGWCEVMKPPRAETGVVWVSNGMFPGGTPAIFEELELPDTETPPLFEEDGA